MLNPPSAAFGKTSHDTSDLPAVLRLRSDARRAFLLAGLLLLAMNAGAADWPAWRFDAQRTAFSPHPIADELEPNWARAWTPRAMAWKEPLNQDLMPFDAVFEPVVLGHRLFLAFNDADKIVALDTRSGQTLWTFRADGPFRLAPFAWRDRLFAVCDDGFLYALDAETGKVLWARRGGPSDRRVLGNERIVSTWPARGAPVVRDDTVYWAAGIWPFMGTFLYALDAETGQTVWVNDATGSSFIRQPHNSPAFGGVAPQGYLVAGADRLVVPGGRSVPACLDRATGHVEYYHLGSTTRTGGSFAAVAGGFLLSHHREKIVRVYDLESGETLLGELGRYPVLTDDIFHVSGSTIRAVDVGLLHHFLDDKEQRSNWEKSVLWEIPVNATGDLIRAGNHLYAAGPQGISIVTLAEDATTTPAAIRTIPVDSDVRRLVAADNRLFAVTLEGGVHAFAEPAAASGMLNAELQEPPLSPTASRRHNSRARQILHAAKTPGGYAFVHGIDDPAPLEALVENSDFHFVVFHPDEKVLAALRAHFDRLGWHGTRIAFLPDGATPFANPPCIASLTIVVRPAVPDPATTAGREKLKRLLRSVRPYGGAIWFETSDSRFSDLQTALAAGEEEAPAPTSIADVEGLHAERAADGVLVTRTGGPPNSANWTHLYADAGNTGVSLDTAVRLPLGVLWFGGTTNVDILPRHAHGPSPLVCDGRLFVQGHNSLSAWDVYTGIELWKREFDNLGTFGVYYDETHSWNLLSTAYNQVHIPGANARGSNYAVASDGVYLITGIGECRRLDPATGRTLRRFVLPGVAAGGNPRPDWGYIGLCDNVLFAGEGFVRFQYDLPDGQTEPGLWENFDDSASRRLVAFDRYSGDVLWTRDARHGFIHNAISLAADRVFCLDKQPPFVAEKNARRGTSPEQIPGQALYALDLHTGDVLWQTTDNIFGSFLVADHQGKHILQSTRPSRDTVAGEAGQRMILYDARTGDVLWDQELEYASPPMLTDELIVTDGRAFTLATGEPARRDNPLTGENVEWKWSRQYGCSAPIASRRYLFFRSAAAAYYDFTTKSGVGNFGGFKAGCTPNLIAAGGVLSAPDYTRTCSCGYQTQTSLALVPLDDAEARECGMELWTYNEIPLPQSRNPIRSIGLNLGAPGDRMADDGTLWLDYPPDGGPSPDIEVRMQPETTAYFQAHSSALVSPEGLPRWVAASGALGVRALDVRLSADGVPPRPCVVRLYFARPPHASPFGYDMEVRVEDQQTGITLPASEEPPVVHSLTFHLDVDEWLNIALTPRDPSRDAATVLCGIEVQTGEIAHPPMQGDALPR